MHIHIDLIAGLTGEDINSFKNSFNIGYNLHAHMLQMGFLKLLYGSDMRENADKYPCEYSDRPPYEVTSTPWITGEEILSLKNCEDALERLYNSGRFLMTLDYLIGDVGLEPFDLFFNFGNSVNGDKLPLSLYAQKFFEFYKDRCNAQLLREKLVCDMLKSGCEKHIPELLKIKDPLYKKVKKELSEKLGNNFSFAVLYSENKIFAVTPPEPRDFFGRKKGRYYKLQ